MIKRHLKLFGKPADEFTAEAGGGSAAPAAESTPPAAITTEETPPAAAPADAPAAEGTAVVKPTASMSVPADGE